MLLLFLALMIVYIVWYQVKWDELKKTIQPQNSWSGIQILTKNWDSIPTISSIVESNNQLTTGKIVNKTWTISQEKTGNTTSVPKIDTGATNKNTNIKLLSGTSIYYGSIAIIEKLGIKYQYALVDGTGISYIYLGTPSYDFASIARALKWDLYTLATEQDILQNKLFGNKVVFINLPEYKDKEVFMLIYLDDGIWLIQINYSLYHKSKSYIKSLFTD